MNENINMVDALHKTIYNQDQQIAELKKQLEEKTKTIQGLVEAQKHLEESASYQMLLDTQKENILLKMQLKSQPAEIVDKIKKGIKDNIICFYKDEDRKSFNRILKSILKLKK